MRPSEVLRPTYEPQEILRWHKIPSGLDIRVDLYSPQKTACIPNPWNWKIRVKGSQSGLDHVTVKVFKNLTIAELETQVRVYARSNAIIFSPDFKGS